MSTHACSTDPCPSCNPRDYEAARTLALNDAKAAEDARFLALHDEIMAELRICAAWHSGARAATLWALVHKVEGR